MIVIICDPQSTTLNGRSSVHDPKTTIFSAQSSCFPKSDHLITVQTVIKMATSCLRLSYFDKMNRISEFQLSVITFGSVVIYKKIKAYKNFVSIFHMILTISIHCAYFRFYLICASIMLHDLWAINYGAYCILMLNSNYDINYII